MTMYASWRDVPMDKWRWPNFSPRELACKGTGRLLLNEDALDKLQELRNKLGKPLLITSAYRSPEHNRAVGGAKRSEHMQGVAFDVRMENQNPSEFEAAARSVGFTGFGYYPRSGFMHIDTGPARTWGTPFAQSDTNLPPEPIRQPESIREDRDVQAAAGVGLLTVVNEANKLTESGAGILDRISAMSPIALLILAVVGYVIWRHVTGKSSNAWTPRK